MKMLILYERKEKVIGANAEAVLRAEDIHSPRRAQQAWPDVVLIPSTDVGRLHILGPLTSNERHMKYVHGCMARLLKNVGIRFTVYDKFARIGRIVVST
jgi:hypothetical protein